MRSLNVSSGMTVLTQCGSDSAPVSVAFPQSCRSSDGGTTGFCQGALTPGGGIQPSRLSRGEKVGSSFAPSRLSTRAKLRLEDGVLEQYSHCYVFENKTIFLVPLLQRMSLGCVCLCSESAMKLELCGRSLELRSVSSRPVERSGPTHTMKTSALSHLFGYFPTSD